MYRIGIDFGGTNIAVGIVDENYKIIAKMSRPTAWPREMSGIINDMAELCACLASKVGASPEEIASVGIASPGVINSAAGEVEYYCGMGLYNFPMVALLKEKLPFGCPVYAANDANAAALAEAMAGAAKGAENAVMITLGTGIGGGIIIGGRIYEGANGAAGELGHFVIVNGGTPCSCGRRGCWEKYASATGLVRISEEEMRAAPDSLMWSMCKNDISAMNGRIPFDACRKNDKAAVAAVSRYIELLACGVTNLINTFQPEVLVVGGGISGEKEYLMEPLRAIVQREQYAKTTKKPTVIVAATLGNDAGIIGAAALGK